MIKPSSVYVSYSREEVMENLRGRGYRAVAFRQPRIGEYWLSNGLSQVVYYAGTFDGMPDSYIGNGMRLIVEKI